MPDYRKHRGAHPEDSKLFAPEQYERLQAAAKDFAFLLSRGYAEKSALKLVGDRYQLKARQRLAILRSACSDVALQDRLRRRIGAEELVGERVYIDGFNLLITLESALAGGFLFRGREGCLRDIASVHRHYRLVEETVDALHRVGVHLAQYNLRQVVWLLDAPVSNSGRLRQQMEELAYTNQWKWQIVLSHQVDEQLKQVKEAIVISTDGVILDAQIRWYNLSADIVRSFEEVSIVPLYPELPRK